MAATRIRRRGPPLGNQNARKHGFYSSVLSPAQQALLPHAKNMRGLTHEIGVARVRLASAVSASPDNPRLLSAAVNSLLRLERTRQATLTRRRTADSRAAKLNRRGIMANSVDITASLPTSSLPKRRIEEGFHRAANLRKKASRSAAGTIRTSGKNA